MPPADADIEDRLLTEATARVTWGDFPEDVTAHLVRQGMDGFQARALVARLAAERNREVRRRSLIKLAAGIGMLLLAVTCFFIYAEARNSGSYLWARLVGMSSAGLLMAGLAAVWRGLSGLAFPAVEELTDVEEGEDPPDVPPPPGA